MNYAYVDEIEYFIVKKKYLTIKEIIDKEKLEEKEYSYQSIKKYFQ